MKILITGETSFLGQKLINKIYNHEVLSLIRGNPLLNQKNVKYLSFSDKTIDDQIKEFKPNVFLNIASSSRLQSNSIDNYKKITDFNISTSSYLVDLAIASGVKKIINITSNWAYLSGDDKTTDFFNYYSFTKFALDKYIAGRCRKSDCQGISLVLYDNFDLHDPRNKIFNLFLKSFMKNIQIDFSPGNQIVNLSRMNEVVDALEFSIFNDIATDQFNYYQITGKEISLKDLAKNMAEILNKNSSNLRFGERPYRTGEIMKPNYYFQELPFIGKRKISLRESLEIEISG
tara:strand:+ start:220 stop:1086 length:867 start_codon:yes stop_codon:yes gene_type:complete